MKKVLLVGLVIAGASLTSCKKDYTCTCTIAGFDDTVTPLNDYKKSDAEDACDALNTSASTLGGSCAL